MSQKGFSTRKSEKLRDKISHFCHEYSAPFYISINLQTSRMHRSHGVSEHQEKPMFEGEQGVVGDPIINSQERGIIDDLSRFV